MLGSQTGLTYDLKERSMGQLVKFPTVAFGTAISYFMVRMRNVNYFSIKGGGWFTSVAFL